MTSNAREKRSDVKTISNLRLLFTFLSVTCSLQILSEMWGSLPSYVPIYYYGNDDGSSDLRRVDPDSPMPTKRPPVAKFAMDPFFRKAQEIIDQAMNDTERCAQYGANALPNDEKHKRRIFFGSMLADENPEVIEANAMEVFNKYNVIALVESNTTHMGTPRTMQFGPGSKTARLLEESELFGIANNTKVVIDYWLEDMPDLQSMVREVEQRNSIWKIWLNQGMSEQDIGIMADLDEIVSRDFLNALQVCDFPKLRYDPKQRATCQKPKMILSTIQFEASPLCVKKREWFHPDLIPGSCILGVGDPSGRVTPEREHKRIYGSRRNEWGKNDFNQYPQDVIDNKRFPLWDGRDIREGSGSDEPLMNYIHDLRKGMGETAQFGTAYHLHNWFKNTEELRHKYVTYGHGWDNAKTIPLSQIQDDIDLMVRCAHGIGHKGLAAPRYEYFEDNKLLPAGEQGSSLFSAKFSVGGNRPIYFQNRSYVENRHALLVKMIKADEEKYGKIHNNTN